MRKRDAIVLLVTCAFIVLNAGALRLGGNMRAKALMCRTNLREIGRALVSYGDAYDGALPTLDRGTYAYHYYVCRGEYPTGSAIYRWYSLGCLFGAGYISDGRTFYCPAAGGGIEEYVGYSSYSPWGTLPQIANPAGGGGQWILARKGYVYWPQSTEVYTTASPPAPGLEAERYKVGLPRAALSLGSLDKNKSVVTDIMFHREGQFKVNALFWDGSVIYQDGPAATDGSRLYFDTKQFDNSADYAAGWGLVKISEWMWQLHK